MRCVLTYISYQPKIVLSIAEIMDPVCHVDTLKYRIYFGDTVEFYVLLTVHPRTISQIIQLGTQFCLNIFAYISSLHVSVIQVPIIRRKSPYLCDTSI